MKKHKGLTIVETEEGTRVVETEAHEHGDCERVHEEAAQKVRGHETVFEASDAHETRKNFGYGRAYAENYDAVFGKN